MFSGNQAIERATYPQSWSPEMVRNASGRAFWFVSRFVSRGLVEYVEEVDGKPKCFRIHGKAIAAAQQRNAGGVA